MPELLIVNENPRRKKRRAASRKRKSTRRRYNPPKAKRRRRRSYTPKYKRRTVRRNPGFMGLNVMDLVGGVGIATGSRLLPSWLRKMNLPIPESGVAGYLSQFGSGLVLSYIVGKFLKQRTIAKRGLEYTAVMVLERFVNDMVLTQPSVSGLFGLGYVGKKTPYYEAPRALPAGMKGLGAGVYAPGNGGDAFTDRTRVRTGARVQLSRIGL